jgi:dethiobiotin synthetase
MSVVFVTASGTAVGKTLVASRLAAEFVTAGRPVRALKPLETGIAAARIADSDGARLLRAQGLPVDDERLSQVTRWRFAAPLSPDVAAAREQRSIPFDELLAFCAPMPGCTTLIEGVGGVMVPIDRNHTVLDWIAALGAPALLVTGSYLGALSHTLTAAHALAARGCTIAAVIVSESREQPMPAAETADVLGRFLSAPVTVLPRCDEKTGAAKAPELLPLIDRWL